MIRSARQQGLPITCDVSINHLHLSDMDIGFFDSNCHLMPPLRSSSDRDALRHGLLDGTIGAICSDHAPVDEDAKALPFAESEPGATGLELLLSLTYKWAQDSGIALNQALGVVTHRSAAVVGSAFGNLAASAGRLVIGGTADICVFDPHAAWTVEACALCGQGRHTPFGGYELPGRVRATFVGGQLA